VKLMRETIRQFVRICAETLPIQEPIYEFGSLQTQGQIGYADLRPYFPNKKYFGADMRRGPGVDVILNLHDIDLPSETVGTVLCLDTLEHVEYPRKAIAEVYRILKPDGLLIVSSIMAFHIHDYPSDYWRFTPEAFKSLLKPFETSFVDFAGEFYFPHTIVGVGFKRKLTTYPSNFLKQIEKWKKYWSHPIRSNLHDWTGLAEMFTPHILFAKVKGYRQSKKRDK